MHNMKNIFSKVSAKTAAIKWGEEVRQELDALLIEIWVQSADDTSDVDYDSIACVRCGQYVAKLKEKSIAYQQAAESVFLECMDSGKL